MSHTVCCTYVPVLKVVLPKSQARTPLQQHPAFIYVEILAEHRLRGNSWVLDSPNIVLDGTVKERKRNNCPQWEQGRLHILWTTSEPR